MELPVHKYLDDLGIKYEKLTFPETTEKGAANVASALGYKERQMVKTLIFEVNTGEKVLVMVGGDQSAVSGNLKKTLGSRDIQMAKPEVVQATTGYIIGSIPPFGWQPDGFRTFIDATLMKEKVLGVGTGKWGNEIIIAPQDLVKASNAVIVNLTDKEQPVFPEQTNIDEGAISLSRPLEPKYQPHQIELPTENAVTKISELAGEVDQEVILTGWMYNKRSSGGITFLQLRDGTGMIQGVVEEAQVSKDTWQAVEELTIESSCIVKGIVKVEPRSPSGYELKVTAVQLVQVAPEYPIGKKEHGPEFLFDNRDLYLRSQTPWAIMRIRDRAFIAITNFFHEEGFVRYDTPILQPTSCEDTTQLFELDYYGTTMYLTQSGQLYSEAGIMSLGKVYDFGPVFRAEKSKTRHHLSELWMMDAEMAYYDQTMNMDLQERLVKRIVKDVLDNCKVELEILDRDTTILQDVVSKPFLRMKHKEAKQILEKEGVKVDYNDDMSTEEEIQLGNMYKLPIFIEDYPAAIKAFYMKNYTDEDGILRARNADLIAPEEGREIIGGSQRLDDYNELLKQIVARNYPLKDYEWYLNIRKYGSVPHSGFGIGFERTLRWITGVHHIRETIPFPRTLVRMRP